MKKVILFLAILSICVVGCVPRYPVTNVNAVDSRPTLSFKGAPKGAVILVDGIHMGEASKYSGSPKVLIVEPGTHEITVMKSDKTIFQQTVFVESEHKIINVH